MRSIISFFVRNNLFADLLTLAVVLVGIYSVIDIRRELFPNVNFDVISVSTIYPSASPEEVERLITNSIEQDLQEVDGIKKIISSSIEGRSGIVIYVDSDQTTAEKAKSDIQDVIDRKTDLPEESKKPIVTSLQSKQSPVIEVSISGDLTDIELRKAAKKIEYELETLPGVARAVHKGLRDLEILIEADHKKLSLYRISLEELITALKTQNLTIPGGLIEVPKGSIEHKEKIIKTTGDFKTLEDIENTVIRANDLGRPIRVKDIASVTHSLERASILTRTNGQPSLSLTVISKENADVIQLVDDVKLKLEQVKSALDSRVQIDLLNDFSEFIRRRLGILLGNFAVGLILVMCILPMMIPFRFAFIIAIGMPLAFLGTFIFLNMFGFSINLISLMGLIIVLGILVDDAIVITENSARLVKDGMSLSEAAIEGTLQVVPSVTASVLTTMMAFLPMMFMTGIFGKFIKEIPIGVITALIVSLLEAFLILPSHLTHWIKAPSKNKDEINKGNFFIRLSNQTQSFWDDRVLPLYMTALKKCIDRRYLVALFGFTLFMASLGLAAKGMRVVLFPPEGIEIFFIRTEAPVGTSLEQHKKLLAPIEKEVSTLAENELLDYTVTVGLVQQDANDPTTRRGSEYAQLQVFLTTEKMRTRTAAEIIEDLRVKIPKPEGLRKMSFTRVNPGPPVGKPISLGVRAEKFENILPAVKSLKETLAEIPGVTDLDDNYTLGKEELRVTINPNEAAAARLNVVSIGNSIRAAYEGIVATSIRELDEEVFIRVSLASQERTNEESLQTLLIPNAAGNLIQLDQVVEFKKGQGLSIYEHEAGRRQVKVSGEVDTKVTSSVEVNNIIREILPEFLKNHPEVSVNFGGEDEDTNESMASLGRAFLLAVMSIFLILVLTFKSLLQPFIVLLTVPLGLISVIFAFFIHNQPLSFMGMLGIIALSGIIVNNAIVFVEFVNQARLRGESNSESILSSAKIRIRAIFLTTVTTVAGVLPTAYGIGGLDKFVVPIALALGWGLIFGSFLSSFIFPASFAILDDIIGFFQRFKKSEKQVS